jgi:ABC-type uncharacterized transport system substrate-binding protein
MIGRREFVAGLGGAAAWPLAVGAQQPAVPVIGYLGNFAEPSASDPSLIAFRKGLRETGYVDGQNVSIEYRSTEGPNDPLIALPLAKDLVERRVSVIVAATVPLAIAVKNLTQTISALLVGIDSFFIQQSAQLIALTTRHRLPAIYGIREIVEAGGLISYGPNLSEAHRLAGNYVGRILKGEKPANLPVQQSTQLEMLVNLKTAKALGLTIPETLLATADEVIQ